MNIRVTQGYGALTEKEKQTLRLIVRGHDAKSIARSLNLSVHTINERLRDARRKMAVSSSREAARLLFDAESQTPNSLADVKIGEAATGRDVEQDDGPPNGTGQRGHRVRITIGVVIMMFAIGFLALATLPQVASSPTPGTTAAADARDSQAVASALRFLGLVDAGQWNESYELFSPSFRKLNTGKVWASVSEQARKPLGAVVSRTLIGQEDLVAPPNDYKYTIIRFRTSFANKADTVETVSLTREGENWRVVGILIG